MPGGSLHEEGGGVKDMPFLLSLPSVSDVIRTASLMYDFTLFSCLGFTVSSPVNEVGLLRRSFMVICVACSKTPKENSHEGVERMFV